MPGAVRGGVQFPGGGGSRGASPHAGPPANCSRARHREPGPDAPRSLASPCGLGSAHEVALGAVSRRGRAVGAGGPACRARSGVGCSPRVVVLIGVLRTGRGGVLFFEK